MAPSQYNIGEWEFEKERTVAYQRRPATSGTTEFVDKFLESLGAILSHDIPTKNRSQVIAELNKLGTARGAMPVLQSLGAIEEKPQPKILPNDKTAHASIANGWDRLVMESLVGGFGRYGLDAVASIAEAAHYSIALAHAFGSHTIFYRGEHKFGYELMSRAERNLPDGAGREPGITNLELDALRRFQKEVSRSKALRRELTRKSWCLPRRNDPNWLPIMQHYDDSFGTRLIDITSSIFAGLYFACINWDGSIDTAYDGVLYAFYRGSGGLVLRGMYYDRKLPSFDEEMDNIAPKKVSNSFRDWKHAEYLRLYQSSSATPREASQDGYFLVRGQLGSKYEFGQGFKFRVPADAKHSIARELWIAGYTPKRIVRGPIGADAHVALGAELGFS